MSDSRIIVLIGRKLSGEISQEESIELADLLEVYKDSIYYDEILKQVWEGKQVEDDVDSYYERHRLKFQDELDFVEEPSIIEAELLSANKSKGYRKYWFTVSLVVLLILSTVLFFYPSKKIDHSLMATELVAGNGIRKDIILPDGTKVWLNAGSKLTYDKGMVGRKKRLVTLSGEAYFDVAHDQHHPFVIKTKRISVKVLGTSFNIKAYEEENQTETTLIKGSVELSVNDRPQERIILRPSEKFTLNDYERNSANKSETSQRERMTIASLSPVVIAEKEYIQETSWMNSYLVFKNESMEELVPKLERWYNVKIEIANPAVKAYRFTGAFSDETIVEALSAMQLIKQYQFKINGHDIKIY